MGRGRRGGASREGGYPLRGSSLAASRGTGLFASLGHPWPLAAVLGLPRFARSSLAARRGGPYVVGKPARRCLALAFVFPSRSESELSFRLANTKASPLSRPGFPPTRKERDSNPWNAKRSTVFETAPIDHSGIFPWSKNKATHVALRCGDRGIRTPEAFRLNGFQDRRYRPLSHISAAKVQLFAFTASNSAKKNFFCLFLQHQSQYHEKNPSFTRLFGCFCLGHRTEQGCKVIPFFHHLQCAGRNPLYRKRHCF